MAGSRKAWGVLGTLGLTPLLLSGCLATPDLPRRSLAASGPTPALLPMADILRAADGGATSALLDPEAQSQADARAAALRARAARLRGPVIAPEDSRQLRSNATALR